MTFEAFVQSLIAQTPPQNIAQELLSLWYDGKGEWEMAHAIAQNSSTKLGARIHAYLHRKEGDFGNAAYWYRKADQQMPAGLTLEEEWQQIVHQLLQQPTC